MRVGAAFCRLLAVFGYGFGIAETFEDGEHLFRQGGCYGYRFRMFPGAETPYLLDLHLAVLVIPQGDRYFHV